uniref:Uncharacterized protein n=1 Tax=Anguilla anguilla TaxID=7936 RepID=A0A0E9UHM0_ANGAN
MCYTILYYRQYDILGLEWCVCVSVSVCRYVCMSSPVTSLVHLKSKYTICLSLFLVLPSYSFSC